MILADHLEERISDDQLQLEGKHTHHLQLLSLVSMLKRAIQLIIMYLYFLLSQITK